MYGKLELVPRSLRDGALTPYSVTVALYIRDFFYVSARDLEAGGSDAPKFEDFPDLNEKQRFLAAVLSTRLIEGPPVQFSRLLLMLRHGLSQLPPEIWTSFMKRLSRIVSSPAVAESEIAALPFVCTGMVGTDLSARKYRFAPDSLVGIFLRKLIMVVDAIDVQESTRIAQGLIKYFIKTGMKSFQATIEPCKKHRDLEDYLASFSLENARHAVSEYWSTVQASNFLDQQCTYLRNNDSRAFQPNVLLPIMAKISECCPTLKKVHQCAYLCAVKARNHPRAEKELHQLGDAASDTIHGLAHHHFDSWDVTTGAFRNTALNAAGLHSEFRQTRNVLISAFESLREARRAHDETALQRASMHLWDNSPSLTIERVEEMVSKLLDNKHAGLAVDRILWLVRSGYVQLVKPIRVFEILHEAEHLCSIEWLWDHLIKTLTHHCSYWSLLGQHEMAHLYSSVALRLRSPKRTTEVKDEVFANMACAQAFCAYQSGNVSRAHQIMVNLVDTYGENGSSADFRYASVWMSLRAFIDCQCAMRNGEWETALKEVRVYRAHRPLHGCLMEAAVLMYSNRCLEALDRLLHLIDELREIVSERDLSSKVSNPEAAHLLAEALLLKCQIHCLAHEASKGVMDLSDAAAIADQHHFVRLQYLATIYLANILSLMDGHATSIVILDKIELDVCGLHGLETMARFDNLRAKIIARQIVELDEKDVTDELLDSGLNALRRASKAFEELEDKVRLKHALVLKDVFLMMRFGPKAFDEIEQDAEVISGLGEGMRICPDILF